MAHEGLYHAMGNTFGTWPPGDPRGWRSLKHREHCEGDYKNPPPPGTHDRKLKRSLALMKRPPVLLNPDERRIVCLALAEKMTDLGAEVVDLCMTDKHFHALARFDGVGEWVDIETAQSRGIAMPRLWQGDDNAPLQSLSSLFRRENSKTLFRVVPGMRPDNMLQDGRDPLPRHVVGIAKKHASHELRNSGYMHEGGAFATRCKVKPIEDRDHKARVEKYIFDHENEGGAVLSLIAPDRCAVRLREFAPGV